VGNLLVLTVCPFLNPPVPPGGGIAPSNSSFPYPRGLEVYHGFGSTRWQCALFEGPGGTPEPSRRRGFTLPFPFFPLSGNLSVVGLPL